MRFPYQRVLAHAGVRRDRTIIPQARKLFNNFISSPPLSIIGLAGDGAVQLTQINHTALSN